jgi:hypothetical protein
MKRLIFPVVLLFFNFLYSQKTENIIVITTDGLRWQELFKGMDTALANDARLMKGTVPLFLKSTGRLM